MSTCIKCNEGIAYFPSIYCGDCVVDGVSVHNMRRFLCYRPNPPREYRENGTANPPREVQFEGCVFSDGTVVVRWMTDYRSHSVWSCWDDLEKVHGHPEYGTVIKWLDDEEM